MYNSPTADGPALAGTDYLPTNGTVIFVASMPPPPISALFPSRRSSDPDETFFVNLSNPLNALLADSQGMGTINNDDPLPALSINDATVTEGNQGTTNAVFTVRLSAVSGQTVTVHFATADGTATAGSDYV